MGLPGKKTMKISLHRDGVRQPWGIRLVGGCDLGTPLIIIRAQVGSPSEGELQRGDIIKKIGDYDSRDLRHEDAQNLFKNAGNTISLVIQRDQAQNFSSSNSRSTAPAIPSPLTMNPPVKGGVATPFAMAAHTPKPSGLSAPQPRNVRASSPVVFPPPLPDEVVTAPAKPTPAPFSKAPAPFSSAPAPFSSAPPAPRPLPSSSLALPASRMIRASSPVVFPPPLPDEVQEIQYVPAGATQMQQLPFTQFRSTPIDVVHNNYQHDGDEAAISNQPYRTTPLVLPGAKVKREDKPTESYLRHHPNPSFRAPPSHFDTPADVLMKQKVADTVLQRVAAADETMAGKQIAHKQFNSPIGLYSHQNIQETIQAQTQTGLTPTMKRAPLLNRKNQSKVSLKKTVSYDPAKSETFKALQEAEMSGEMQEVTVPVQTRVFSPSAPTKVKQAPVNGTAQPFYNQSQPRTASPQTYVNSLGQDELIHQSGTFKRLMHQVLGDY